MKNPAAVALGKLGGSKSTPRKRKASLKSLKKARAARLKMKITKAANQKSV